MGANGSLFAGELLMGRLDPFRPFRFFKSSPLERLAVSHWLASSSPPGKRNGPMVGQQRCETVSYTFNSAVELLTSVPIDVHTVETGKTPSALKGVRILTQFMKIEAP